MKNFLSVFFILLFISNCTLNKVIKHHGVHFLEVKQKKIIVNKTNRNDLYKELGPPSTVGKFDNDMLIYIERKTSTSKITKLGKKELLTNDVLILEVDKRGIIISKKFLNKDDINEMKFINNTTDINYDKASFLYGFMSTLRQKINDPLGKKRGN
jgi:outer membrane protein assembly factor BamE (lipoprotein component of BamABCDE complex)